MYFMRGSLSVISLIITATAWYSDWPERDETAPQKNGLSLTNENKSKKDRRKHATLQLVLNNTYRNKLITKQVNKLISYNHLKEY